MNPLYDYDKAWFELPKADQKAVARALIETVQDIERRQVSIFEGNRRHARSYAGYLPKSLDSSAQANSGIRAPFAATKALVRSVCDTATALISRFRPRPAFITTGANWEVQQQAQDMDIFMAGAYEKSGIYQVSPRSFHDTTVFGTGLWKYVPRGQGDKWFVSVERVQPDDMVVDEAECPDNLEPENMYHRVSVSTNALIRRYALGDSKEAKELRRDILAASSITTWPNRSVAKDRCIVVDATHVDPYGDNHRRVVAIEGRVLSDERWPEPWHPYTVLWWAPPISGFYGDGVAYRQYGRQERITYMYRWVQRCHDLFATPRAWIDPVGGPPVSQITNEIGVVISARRKPEFQVNPVVPPEIYAWIDELGRGGFEDEGIAQTTAHNELPKGIESAPAQREYNFKESNRFAPVSQRWEHSIAVDSCLKMMAMYRRHAEATEGEGLSMRWADRKLLHSVNWPDLPEDSFQIRPMASSFDSLSPAARLQAAIELSQTNWLLPGEGRALLGHPDLEESDRLNNAPTVYAKRVLQKLLRGEVVELDEYGDPVTLDAIIRRGRLDAINRGAPKELIDNCSAFLDQLDAHMKRAVQASMSTGPIAPPAAQGMPLPFAGGQG